MSGYVWGMSVAAAGLLISPAVSAAGEPNNLNPDNTLCLDLRGAGDANAQGQCLSLDSECGGGGDLQCTDDDFDPLNGAICVNQACYGLGEQIVVDLELGPTSEPACGAQYFLQWDTASLLLNEIEVDPDAELGWFLVFILSINHQAGTIDVIHSLPIGVPCNDITGATLGGTLARMTFTPITECKISGVFFRPHNPPTRVGGPGGAIPITACDGGDLVFSATDYTAINESPPVWVCPDSSSGGADCGTNMREVHFAPLAVSDSCDQITDPITDLCTVEYFPRCAQDGDCLGSAACIDGTCDEPVDPAGIDLEDYLYGGGDFLPGRTQIRCTATNGCGITADCNVDIVNTGYYTMIIDLEMSPTMVPGNPQDPITRCIDFEVFDCDHPYNSFKASQEVVFGAPANLPGHGTAEFEIPPANWSCITAVDPKHSLKATCLVGCFDGTFHGTFKGSPDIDPICSWLVQGNLNGSDFIDIVDYAILGAQYFSSPGPDTMCGQNGFHADFNGDGLVTLSDATFIIINFLRASAPLCETTCGP